MDQRPLYVIDAFAERPFAGNPAAVVLLDAPAPEPWMQMVAAEMRHSETAFVHPAGDGVHGLRWFTPVAEVELCGHATLASARALLEAGRESGERPIRFATCAGELRAAPDGEMLILDFPSTPPAFVRDADADELSEALRTAVRRALRTEYDRFVVLEDPSGVLDLRPDFERMAAIATRGVIVTAAGGDGADFTSRFFAPRLGIDEDPVTGAAHCALAPYWGAVLGRTEMTGHQASARGGRVQTRLRGDRVELGGTSHVIVTGTITGPP